MTDTLDLIVIGAGMAGISAAKKCARAGWSVAIVDELPYGGTCALRGCDPKKMLRAGAEAVEAARLMSGKGVTGEARIDWPALMKHKESFTDPVPESMESALTEAGVKTLHGRARFTAKDRIEIEGHPELLENVGAAAERRGRAIAVLGHRHPAAGNHQGGRGRNIEGARPITARTAEIDHPLTIWLDPDGCLAHAFHEAGDLLDGLSPDPQGQQEGGNLHRSRLP